VKRQVASRVGHLEGLVSASRFCSMCGGSDWLSFVGSTSLIVHGESNNIIVASHHMFTQQTG